MMKASGFMIFPGLTNPEVDLKTSPGSLVALANQPR
jgi:hypothetical protein